LSEEEFKAVIYYIKNGIQFEKKLKQQKDIAKVFLENKVQSFWI
jgi:hypothetical protein